MAAMADLGNAPIQPTPVRMGRLEGEVSRARQAPMGWTAETLASGWIGRYSARSMSTCGGKTGAGVARVVRVAREESEEMPVAEFVWPRGAAHQESLRGREVGEAEAKMEVPEVSVVTVGD